MSLASIPRPVSAPGRRRDARPGGALLMGPVRGVLIGLLAVACTNDSGDWATTQLQDVQADEIVYGVSISMTHDGVRKASLTADSMFSWRDSTHALVLGLSVVVYSDRGGRLAMIESERGRLRVTDDAGSLEAYGNAVLKIPDQDREIWTEELHVEPESERIWSDVPVVMRYGDCEIEGDRMQADMNFDDVRIWGTRDRDCPG